MGGGGQAEQETASSGPCSGSPQDKGRAVRGNVILFGQAKTLIGPRRQKGPRVALRRLWGKRGGEKPGQAVTALLLGTALISVVHQVIPLGCALGKVYLC